MRLFRSAVLGALALALASCTAGSSTPTAAGPSYTCCDAADINRDYQPGETVAIHWIAVPGSPGSAGPTGQVELNAHLTGPYATVDELKQAGPDPAQRSTFTAEPLHPSGHDEPPVSLIPIPSTAVAGYYNLTTSVTRPGLTASGASVIQVIAPTRTAAGPLWSGWPGSAGIRTERRLHPAAPASRRSSRA